MIKHIWFDQDGTLTVHTSEFHRDHNLLRYQTYADLVKKPLTLEIEAEYEELYKRYGSNSAVFRSLGMPSDYWQIRFNTLDPTKYYKPIPAIYETLKKLKDTVPISIFTNVKSDNISRTLASVSIDPAWFTYIITGDDITERKPALEGFRLMIKKSALSSAEILYVGDRVDVDIKPAKELGIKTGLVYGKSKLADYSFKNFDDILTIF